MLNECIYFLSPCKVIKFGQITNGKSHNKKSTKPFYCGVLGDLILLLPLHVLWRAKRLTIVHVGPKKHFFNIFKKILNKCFFVTSSSYRVRINALLFLSRVTMSHSNSTLVSNELLKKKTLAEKKAVVHRHNQLYSFSGCRRVFIAYFL